MKKIPVLFVFLTYALMIHAAVFESGGESIQLKNLTVQKPSGSSAVNYIHNGSFELPGTSPNGWNAEKNRGWIGWHNQPVGKTAEEKQAYRLAGASQTRTLVSPGSEGNAAVSICSRPVVGADGKNIPIGTNKMRQHLKIPVVKAGGDRYEFSMKCKGEATSIFYVLISARKETGSGSKLFSIPVTITPEWRTFTRFVNLPVGTTKVELDLMLQKYGEVTIDELCLSPAPSGEKLKVECFPARTDGIFAVGENLPGLLTFAFDHSSKLTRNNLRLAIELPPEFQLADYRRTDYGKAVKQKENIWHISLNEATDNMLRNFYQYQAFSVMLISSRKASDQLYPLKYHVLDNDWTGTVHQIHLKIIPAVKARTPKMFKTSADFNHEIDLGEKGLDLLTDFYLRHGFNAVHGVPYRPFYQRMKKAGIERFCELYNLANGYYLGRDPKPREAAFIRLDGTPFPRGICPTEVYRQGPFFQSAVRDWLDKLLNEEDLADSFMPNWEPFMFDSRGCFCNRCRDEFIRYCKGSPSAEEIKAAWPRSILKSYAPIWIRFRSWQHSNMVRLLEKVISEAGRKSGKDSHFIPEITIDGLLFKNHSSREQYATTDYAYDLPWINVWGPYVWHDLDDYNEYFPAPGLPGHIQKDEVWQFLKKHAPSPRARLPKLLSLPHGWQGYYWVTTPEAIAMEMSSLLFQKWHGSFLYFFPRGYDYRYWRAVAQANDRIAEAEETVFNGRDCTDQVKLIPVTGLPKLYFNVVSEAASPRLRNMSPIQCKAFRQKDRILIGVGNFWKKGEHFFRLQVSGLSGRHEVRTPEISRGIFTADELARGVLMQVGALRWQYIYLEKTDRKLSRPVFGDQAMERLLQQRKPLVDAALQMEQKVYDKRFKALDYSQIQPVDNGPFKARVKNNLIEIATPGQLYKINPGKGGEITAPAMIGKAGFWWTSRKAVELTSPFAVKSIRKAPDGLIVQLERLLDASDCAALAGLKVSQTYHFRKNQIEITAVLHNTQIDAIPLAFRFKNMVPVQAFQFPEGQTVRRNLQVSIYRTGTEDGELDTVCRIDSFMPVKPGPVQAGDYRFSTPDRLYGYVVWDSAGMKRPTFEPVYEKTNINPGAKKTYKLTIDRTR